MVLNLHLVKDFRQIIVPIRFARAITGPPSDDSPDLDDRGFQMGTRPRTWGETDTKGAMVGILVGTTIELQVLREDIEDLAELYISSTDDTLVEVISPAAGTPLGTDNKFRIRALRDMANRCPSILVHYNAQDGPVIGELEAHTFNKKKLRVIAHMVEINGVGPTRTAADLNAVFEEVNKIWQPCGIEFEYKEAETMNEVVNDPSMTAGTITTNIAANDWAEFSRVLQLNPVDGKINIYFARASNEWVGLTYDNDIPRPNGYGIAIVDNASNIDIAHELGHFLNLDRHSDERPDGTVFRDDMWSIRRLMYSVFPPAAPAHRNDVGYGSGQYGAMLTLKNFAPASDPNDNELATTRDRARNPY